MYHTIKPIELTTVLMYCDKFMNPAVHQELRKTIKPILKDLLHTIWDEDAELVIMEKPF